jgi:hypothetical protein
MVPYMFEFDHTPLPIDADISRDDLSYSYDDDGHKPQEQQEKQRVASKDPKPTQTHAQRLQRLHTTHALHPLTQDESTTYHAMLAQDDASEVFIMPTHCIDETGNLNGFRFVVDSEADCVQLPITRNIFKGTTSVECDPGDKPIHPDVIKLLNDPAAVRATIKGVLIQIATHAPGELLSIDHMPVSTGMEAVDLTPDDHCTGPQRNKFLLDNLIEDRLGRHSSNERGRDSHSWKVDLPSAVGVYHAYVRSRETSKREHKLLIVVSGGCRRASEQFYNMNLDLVGDATAAEVQSCEEAWWLRRASTRSRCRVAKIVAESLNLTVPMTRDTHAFEEGDLIPVYTTNTINHNLSETDNGGIAVFNNCCDTTAVTNGILCTQAQSEGVWLFQGSNQTAISALSNHGGRFGDQSSCGAFPTGTFCMFDDVYQLDAAYSTTKPANWQTEARRHSEQSRNVRLNLVKHKPCAHVIYYNPLTGVEIDQTGIDFDTLPADVKWDEAFIDHLTTHEWKREYQVVELIPIVTAVEYTKA